MNIYTLSLKNLSRNKLRNSFAILRITIGVVILLLLVSSGLGLNTFLKQASSFTNDSSSQTAITSITDELNSLFGTDITHSIVVTYIQTLFNNLIYILDGIASVAFLVGILDIINTMSFNLNERKREIGILKTLGFSKKQLIISLSLEACLLGLLGSIAGVIVGVVGLSLLSNIIGIPISILIPLWLIVAAITITTMLSMLLGLFPAWFASGEPVSEALNNG